MHYRKIIFFVFFFALTSCGKQNDFLPDIPVTFQMSLGNPTLNRLSVIGGAVTIDGYGISGLIICRFSNDGYVAFDRCSTVNPEKRCAVTLDSPPFTATDPCSGAKFNLFDGSGSPAKAPATISLKKYRVSISQNTIFVTN